jgi:uncharacterized protein
MSDRRPVDHAGMEILSGAECNRLLHHQQVGRIGFLEAGEPVVLPVVYRFHEGHVFFRSAVGAKLDLAELQRPVGFEIDGWDAAVREGWSVLIRGIPHAVTRPDRIAELESLGVEQWVHGPYPLRWIVIAPDDITGRRISGPRRDID